MNEQRKTLELILMDIVKEREFVKACLRSGGYRSHGVKFAAESRYKMNLELAVRFRQLACLYESQDKCLNGDIFNAIDMFEKEIHDNIAMLRNTGYTEPKIVSKLPDIVVGLMISIAILTVSIGVQLIWGYFYG